MPRAAASGRLHRPGPRAPAGPIGPGFALQFVQLPNAVGIGQDITFTFASPVFDVAFRLFDIDNATASGWGDRVEVLTGGHIGTIPLGGAVIGTGTAADPYRSSQPNTSFADSSNQGNLTLTFAGPISSFSLRYTNAVNVGGLNARVGMGDITFLPCPP